MSFLWLQNNFYSLDWLVVSNAHCSHFQAFSLSLAFILFRLGSANDTEQENRKPTYSSFMFCWYQHVRFRLIPGDAGLIMNGHIWDSGYNVLFAQYNGTHRILNGMYNLLESIQMFQFNTLQSTKAIAIHANDHSESCQPQLLEH